jgi:tetrahydromethanopterin S-methyltransferase subunit A
MVSKVLYKDLQDLKNKLEDLIEKDPDKAEKLISRIEKIAKEDRANQIRRPNESE